MIKINHISCFQSLGDFTTSVLRQSCFNITLGKNEEAMAPAAPGSVVPEYGIV